LGKAFADSVTHEQVLKAHRAIKEGKTAVRARTKSRGVAKVTGGKGTANKAVSLLSTIFDWSIKNKLVVNNPAKNMGFGPSAVRDTVIGSAEEYGRLFATLERMENEKRIRSAAADAIRFIALTGTRRGEATGLRWQWVDLKSGLITLPPKAHKAGHRSGKPRIIALPVEAQAIIARQPQGEPDSYVFRPAKGTGAIELHYPWVSVRTEAGLSEKLGLHGLRHSVGTHLAMAGASAVELMEMLGHKQISTTLRYVHFAEQARSNLAERGAAVAMAGLRGNVKKAGVIRIRKRGGNRK
jgi:integrase